MKRINNILRYSYLILGIYKILIVSYLFISSMFIGYQAKSTISIEQMLIITLSIIMVIISIKKQPKYIFTYILGTILIIVDIISPHLVPSLILLPIEYLIIIGYLRLSKSLKKKNKLYYSNQSNKLSIKELLSTLKNKPLKVKLIYLMIIISIILIPVTISIVNIFNKDYYYLESLNNIEEPIQLETEGHTTKIINGTKVNINYVAEYSISGRVVDVQNYYGFDLFNKLMPLDLGISWGPTANKENNYKILYSSAGNRILRYRSLSYNDEILVSNNHLIPSNNKIKRLLKTVNENDYIKLEGYLVNVNYNKKGQEYNHYTSTIRTDAATDFINNGGCEIIYVTNVKWLKEKR